MKTNNTTRYLHIVFQLVFVPCSSMISTASAVDLNIAQSPLTVSQSASPQVMLNISKDHQLFFKAFDDYSDLDGDGLPETTYKHI
jgi:type IV pilus assembly protein PilY1